MPVWLEFAKVDRAADRLVEAVRAPANEKMIRTASCSVGTRDREQLELPNEY